MEMIDALLVRYPQLTSCRAAIVCALELINACYRNGGKVLVCGNGGSASDAEHIVGELMKKFRRQRAIPSDIAAALPPELSARLEGALPAVSLVSMTSLVSAFANDVAWDTAFAQQVLGLGNRGDVLIALTTSGNSANCLNAALVARAKGLSVISLTGKGGGQIAAVSDAAIAVPETETYKVQELHLPIYHALCAAAEDEFFA